MFTKPPYLKIVLILWLVFSLLYIGYNEWSRFKNGVMERAYQQGVTDAVTKIITDSKACKAVPLFVGDAKAEIVNVECLKGEKGGK